MNHSQFCLSVSGHAKASSFKVSFKEASTYEIPS